MQRWISLPTPSAVVTLSPHPKAHATTPDTPLSFPMMDAEGLQRCEAVA
jgi:hypothetical protein